MCECVLFQVVRLDELHPTLAADERPDIFVFHHVVLKLTRILESLLTLCAPAEAEDSSCATRRRNKTFRYNCPAHTVPLSITIRKKTLTRYVMRCTFLEQTIPCDTMRYNLLQYNVLLESAVLLTCTTSDHDGQSGASSTGPAWGSPDHTPHTHSPALFHASAHGHEARWGKQSLFHKHCNCRSRRSSH